MAFDKTGTLTRNRPEVATVVPAADVHPEEVLALAAALEASSTHPLAEAVRLAAPGSPYAAGDVQEHAGHGVSGVVQGRSVRVGSPRWVSPEALAREMQDRLQEALGITFGVGLASTKTLAKIASKRNKPAGLTLLPERERRAVLADTQVYDVWGLGGAFAEPPIDDGMEHQLSIGRALERASAPRAD